MKTIYFLCGPLLTVVIMTEERRGQKRPRQYFRHSWANVRMRRNREKTGMEREKVNEEMHFIPPHN